MQIKTKVGRQGLTVLPRLECSGVIMAHCHLKLLGSKKASHSVTQAGLELTVSSDFSTLASQNAGILGEGHLAELRLKFCQCVTHLNFFHSENLIFHKSNLFTIYVDPITSCYILTTYNEIYIKQTKTGQVRWLMPVIPTLLEAKVHLNGTGWTVGVAQGGQTEVGWGAAPPGKCSGPEGTPSYPTEAIGDVSATLELQFQCCASPVVFAAHRPVDPLVPGVSRASLGGRFSQCHKFPAHI
ncbi:hypothetical protein AAY473_006817 [Plecturocebus cupreus]